MMTGSVSRSLSKNSDDNWCYYMYILALAWQVPYEASLTHVELTCVSEFQCSVQYACATERVEPGAKASLTHIELTCVSEFQYSVQYACATERVEPGAKATCTTHTWAARVDVPTCTNHLLLTCMSSTSSNKFSQRFTCRFTRTANNHRYLIHLSHDI